MPASEPSWWYADQPGFIARCLRPVSRVYDHVAERRFRTTAAYVSRLPVICVGNFTAGGTGKTPFTQTLVGLLIAGGARPAILSRGYGGSTRGPHAVDPARDGAALVGDEPLLLAASAPVMVARDRAAGARAIESDARGFTHIVMDDGLQNPALQKSLTFAIVDGARGLGNGEVIPAGPLRASLARQLPRVDAIVVNTGFAQPKKQNAVAAQFERTFHGPVLEAAVTPQFDLATLTAPVVAFAGIGVPERFFGMLRSLGVTLADTIAFPDHHAFSDRDAQQLLDRAQAQKAALLTTEKDLARLAGHGGLLGDLSRAARAVPIRMTLSGSHQLRLDALLAPLVATA